MGEIQQACSKHGTHNGNSIVNRGGTFLDKQWHITILQLVVKVFLPVDEGNIQVSCSVYSVGFDMNVQSNMKCEAESDRHTDLMGLVFANSAEGGIDPGIDVSIESVVSIE